MMLQRNPRKLRLKKKLANSPPGIDRSESESAFGTVIRKKVLAFLHITPLHPFTYLSPHGCDGSHGGGGTGRGAQGGDTGGHSGYTTKWISEENKPSENSQVEWSKNGNFNTEGFQQNDMKWTPLWWPQPPRRSGTERRRCAWAWAAEAAPPYRIKSIPHTVFVPWKPGFRIRFQPTTTASKSPED